MVTLKYFLFSAIFFFSGESWKFNLALNSSILPKSNLTRPQEHNAVISTGNENLISTNLEVRNRLSKMNFTQADTNDGKIAEHSNTPAGKRIKSEKMEFESDEKTQTNINEVKLPNKTRSPVKLNTKQGLIMNQILSTYGLSDVNNSLCKAHITEFKLGLRALEPWALKMFDSSSKLMPGILGGNLAELGSWRQCLHIHEETASGLIKGRHCMLYLYPSEELLKIILSFRKTISEKHFQNMKANVLEGVKLMWSVCVPHTCSHNEVLRHFSKLVAELTDGLDVTVTLPPEHCVSTDDLPRITDGDYVFMFCVGTVLVLVIYSTFADVLIPKERTSGVIYLFSLKRNAAALFSPSRNNDDINCLHGIRTFAIYVVVYGHRFIHNLITPAVNSMDYIDWLETYKSTTIHGATITVDTFIVLSSSLLGYMYFTMTSRGVKINILLFYLNRHLRLLVPLLLAIGSHIVLTKHLGGGPLYHDFAKAYTMSCKHYWWTTLLNIQPFVNPKELCIPQTWFLSIDMFWYYMSPFLLLALDKNRLIGYVVLISVYLACTVINFYLAWNKGYIGNMPVTPSLLTTDYFAYHYIQPLVRGGPYILGLMFGHALFRTKDRKVKISTFINTVGWIAVSIFLPLIVMTTRSFLVEGYEYNRLYSSFFLATHRSAWSLCIMWIIWACHNGYGGIVNDFFSWDTFRIIGKLSYNVFLFHFFYQGAMQSSAKTPTYFSHFLSTVDSLGDILIMLILAVPLVLCFEYPFNRMCGLMLRRRTSPSNKIVKVKPSELNNKI